MKIVTMRNVGRNFVYQWPGPEGPETYDYYVEYIARAEDGEHNVKIGIGTRHTYGRDRVRVVVFIDNHPHGEFLGADDFDNSGEVLSEIRVPGDKGERICRYPDEPIPERYTMFDVVGLPTRVRHERVHGAWAVVANVGDHKSLVGLAGLRRLERLR